MNNKIKNCGMQTKQHSLQKKKVKKKNKQKKQSSTWKEVYTFKCLDQKIRKF